MEEKELARFHESRRDDMSLWAEKPSKANVRRGGTVIFSVRFDPEELVFLRQKAEETGMTVSELVRRGAMREANRETYTTVNIVGTIPKPTNLPYVFVPGVETSPLAGGRSESGNVAAGAIWTN